MRKYTRHIANMIAFLIGLAIAVSSLGKGFDAFSAGAISFAVVIALLLLFNAIADKLGFEKMESPLWSPLWWF